MNTCSECGHLSAADALACEKCGHARKNGAMPSVKNSGEKPPPPPELSGLVIHKTPPEMIEEARRTFNEEAFLAELREVERNGKGELKDFLHDLEQEAERP